MKYMARRVRAYTAKLRIKSKKRRLSGSKKLPAEGEEFRIFDLPQEMTETIVSKLDLPTRLALRMSCRLFHKLESTARMNLEELALYRTADDEFTLSVKDNLSATWLFVQNLKGENFHQWKDDGDTSRKLMHTDARNTVFIREETPLGELSASIRDYMNRSSVDKITIDGFHCSDSSMAALCGLVRSDSVKEIFLSSPFTTTSDDRFHQLLHNCPQLRSLTLAIHRCTPKDVVIEKDFLLFATSRLDKVVVHSRGLRQCHSTDQSDIDNDLLIKLLSTKCSHLDLLYFLPLLTARGIIAAVEVIAKRDDLPTAEFKTYFRSDLYYSVCNFLEQELNAVEWKCESAKDPVYVIPINSQCCIHVKIYQYIIKQQDYSKIIVRKKSVTNGILTIGSTS